MFRERFQIKYSVDENTDDVLILILIHKYKI